MIPSPAPSEDNNQSSAGISTVCINCGSLLCIRKQAINLALGQTEKMQCLNCFARDNDRLPQEILSEVKDYIQRRECFRKVWGKYQTTGDCPEPDSCFPGNCFE